MVQFRDLVRLNSRFRVSIHHQGFSLVRISDTVVNWYNFLFFGSVLVSVSAGRFLKLAFFLLFSSLSVFLQLGTIVLFRRGVLGFKHRFLLKIYLTPGKCTANTIKVKYHAILSKRGCETMTYLRLRIDEVQKGML